jgi:hypothetical protein
MAGQEQGGTLRGSAGAPGAWLAISSLGNTLRVTEGGRRWTANAAQPKFRRQRALATAEDDRKPCSA